MKAQINFCAFYYRTNDVLTIDIYLSYNSNELDKVKVNTLNNIH